MYLFSAICQFTKTHVDFTTVDDVTFSNILALRILMVRFCRKLSTNESVLVETVGNVAR